jgi:hypothetical protein
VGNQRRKAAKNKGKGMKKIGISVLFLNEKIDIPFYPKLLKCKKIKIVQGLIFFLFFLFFGASRGAQI